jgi:hypothetical protein
LHLVQKVWGKVCAVGPRDRARIGVEVCLCKIRRIAQGFKNRTVQFAPQIHAFANSIVECEFQRGRADNANLGYVNNLAMSD